jgi:hypothetical protein
VDYITTSETANDSFTFSDDALIQCVPVPITSDSVKEPGEECFTFTISTTTSVAGLTLSPSETEICIEEGVDLAVHWQENYHSASEGDGHVELCAKLSTLQFEGSVQVDYATYSDSAKGPEDFIDKNGTFTFTNATSTQCTSIVIVNDTVSESHNECFTVELSNATETIDNPNVATVCITERKLRIGFEKTAYTVSEVDGFQVVCIDVLSGDVDGREIILDYSTSSGSASSSDYSHRSGDVTISDDDTYQCVSIPITTDSYVEHLQCFTIQIGLSNTVDNVTVDPARASICIFDRNYLPITIGFTKGLYTVSESVGSLEICYKIHAGRTASRSINMQFRTAQGEVEDFADGNDYTYTHTTGIINDSNSSVCSTVSIISDAIDEEKEYFIAILSTTSTFVGLILNPEVAIVHIIDDDRELRSYVNCCCLSQTVVPFVFSHTCNHWTSAHSLLSV